MSAIQFSVILSCAWFATYNAETTRILNTKCINVRGKQLQSASLDSSVANCPVGYKIVSCGIDTTVTQEFSDGYLYKDDCVAHLGEDAGSSDYVVAVARCCKLHTSADCESTLSGSGSDDDDRITTQCKEKTILTGCTAFALGEKEIHGSYPGTQAVPDYETDPPSVFTQTLDPLQACTAQNSVGVDGIYANIRCCSYTNSDIKLECGVYRGVGSGIKNNDIGEVGCPSGYFLSGCSGHSMWKGLKSWFTNDDDKCVVRTSNSGRVWPYAICCQEIDSSCDKDNAGNLCETDDDCTGCMVCCKEKKVCHDPRPAAVVPRLLM